MESKITIYDPTKGTREDLENAIKNEVKNLDDWCLKQVYRLILNIQRED